jgi:hypothetical protein
MMTLAFNLAKLGLHVFPLAAKDQPYTKHGHLDATTDPEIILEYWSEYPRAMVGVHTGASGIVVLDIDKKGLRDGFESLELQWVEIPPTFHYPTQNDGTHHIYQAPDGIALNGQKDYRHWQGVDRKGGSSYVVWYGDAPESRDVFAAAPQWLLDPANAHVGSSFEGGLDEWLARLDPGVPDAKVQAAILRIPETDFGHDILIARQFELVRMAAEGHPGIRQALEALRTAWLRPPWDSADYAYEFDAGLDGAIKKAGAEDERIANLPLFADTLELLGDQELNLLIGPDAPAAHYFKVLRVLVAVGLSDEQIASLVWSAGTTKSKAREWGIDYLYAQIAEARVKAVPGENPALIIDEQEVKPADYTLLSAEERVIVDGSPTWVDRYVDTVEAQQALVNVPYHRANAWTVLSLAMGMFAFIPVTNTRKMGMNLFQIILGESSSGKSDALTFRDELVREFFHSDPGVDLGSDVSIEALQEYLIKRDHMTSWFNADEAAVLFSQMTKDGTYLGGLESSLTKYYEGYVPPVLKKSAKDIAGKSALVSFNISLFGTPEKVTDALTEEMFESGFLARFIWTIGDPVLEVSAEDTETEATEAVAKAEYDEVARALAVELYRARRIAGPGKHPILSDSEAVLRRIGKCRDDMRAIIRDHPRHKILAPSVRRLGDNVRKAAALLALSEGRTTVSMVDVLCAVSECERWLADLVDASEQVAGSRFARDCDSIEAYVLSKGGRVSRESLFHSFRKYEPRDFMARLESLRAQGRLVPDAAEKHYEINQKKVA